MIHLQRCTVSVHGIYKTSGLEEISDISDVISDTEWVVWYVGMNTIHKIYIGELRGFDSETNDLFL